MKALLTSIFTFICGSSLFAQAINYEVLRDAPEKHTKYHVNLTYLDMGFNVSDISSFGLGFGLWGGYEILNERLYSDIDFRKSYYTFGGVSKFDLNMGSTLMLLTTNKLKNRKFILKSSTTRGTNSNGQEVDITESTYITIPYKKQVSLGVRGGISSKKTSIEKEINAGKTNSQRFTADHSQFGLYLGGVLKIRKNTIVKTNRFGTSGKPVTFEWYADLLLVPVATSKNVEFGASFGNPTVGDETKYVKDNSSNSGPLGVRMGLKIYTEVKKDSISGRTIPMAVNAEYGLRPYIGFYATVGLGITILRGI